MAKYSRILFVAAVVVTYRAFADAYLPKSMLATVGAGLIAYVAFAVSRPTSTYGELR